MSSASTRSPRSAASPERAATAPAIAPISAAGAPRAPASSLLTRRPPSSSMACSAPTGGSATARSASSSTSVPPAPTTISRPSAGSRLRPMLSSTPAGDSGVGVGQRLRAGDPQQHAARLGLVRYPGLVGLEYHRVADGLGRRQRLREACRGLGPRGGDAILAQQR